MHLAGDTDGSMLSVEGNGAGGQLEGQVSQWQWAQFHCVLLLALGTYMVLKVLLYSSGHIL